MISTFHAVRVRVRAAVRVGAGAGARGRADQHLPRGGLATQRRADHHVAVAGQLALVALYALAHHRRHDLQAGVDLGRGRGKGKGRGTGKGRGGLRVRFRV